MSPSPRLATRSSALATTQARWVAGLMGGAMLVEARSLDRGPGDKGRFVRGVEAELLEGNADVGVHSAKDLPGELPRGLALAGVPEREDPRDVFVGEAASLEDVPEGARVGTASLRRRSQLLAIRPDLELVELRGNVDTRLAKVSAAEVDGAVLAAAGLGRLGRVDEIAFAFDPERMTPAPGQGALALETRSDDAVASELAASVTDARALTELTAERAAVRALGATCETPVGVMARCVPEEEAVCLIGFAGLPDGSQWVRDELTAPVAEASEAGRRLGERMLSAGAGEILERAGAQAAR